MEMGSEDTETVNIGSFFFFRSLAIKETKKWGYSWKKMEGSREDFILV